MSLPKGFEPIRCTCRPRASWTQDATANCRCKVPACIVCREEPAEALYLGEPVSIECGQLAQGRMEVGLEPFVPREIEALGQPLPPLIRQTPDGVKVIDEFGERIAS